MSSGAIIQFATTLKPSWIQIWRWAKIRCKLSYLTLQRIGYIMTNNPTAVPWTIEL